MPERAEQVRVMLNETRRGSIVRPERAEQVQVMLNETRRGSIVKRTS